MASLCEKKGNKKLLNAIDRCVDDSLAGLVATNDRLRLIAEHRIVVRADHDAHVRVGRKVALLSGGGSGHEPTFAGLVGEGLLTAAVAGAVFASPRTSSVTAALDILGKGNTEGTLVVVANYTGDRMTFGLAVERAKSTGHRIEMLLVADDCALVSHNRAVGRRGLCGIALVLKIAGSMAEQGFSLDAIVSRLPTVQDNLGTIGMCLSPCSPPGVGYLFHLGDDEFELGLGVHGEAGVARKKMSTAKETVDVLFSHMTDVQNCSRLQIAEGDRVVLVVNNLGGTTQLEMNVAAYEAIGWLECRGVLVERVFVAPIMTSLDMAGISLTVLRVNDDDVLGHIDYKTSASGWPVSCQRTKVEDGGRGLAKRIESTIIRDVDALPIGDDVVDEVEDAIVIAMPFRRTLEAACRSLLVHRSELNELDSGCGDGDSGSTLASGAERVIECLSDGTIDVSRPATLVLGRLSDICQTVMGGTSGAFYGIFFATMSASLSRRSKTSTADNDDDDDDDEDAWLGAVCDGTAAIAKYGGAEKGDRTMLDALHGLIDAWKSRRRGKPVSEPLLRSLAFATRSAAESTVEMQARVGRASYVNAVHCDRPDPGAMAVAIIVDAIAGHAFHETS